jgi:hypothetical protein
MAKQVSIPITADSPPACVSYYNVRYKAHTSDAWSTLSPAPTESPIIISPLPDGETWDLQVQRFCCNGASSNVVSTTFTT